jgi:Arc/MetJ family transcription regulator
MTRVWVEIADDLLAEAKEYSGKQTIEDVVEAGLELLIRKGRLAEIAAMKGSGTSLTQETLQMMREDD